MVIPLDTLTGCAVPEHISRELSMLAHTLRCWANLNEHLINVSSIYLSHLRFSFFIRHLTDACLM